MERPHSLSKTQQTPHWSAVLPEFDQSIQAHFSWKCLVDLGAVAQCDHLVNPELYGDLQSWRIDSALYWLLASEHVHLDIILQFIQKYCHVCDGIGQHADGDAFRYGGQIGRKNLAHPCQLFDSFIDQLDRVVLDGRSIRYDCFALPAGLATAHTSGNSVWRFYFAN